MMMNDPNEYLNPIELQFVKLIRKYINYVITGSIRQRELGIKWIYEHKTTVGQATLQECCRILELPYELVRIRMQVELFRNSITWDNINCELPAVIDEEIRFYYSTELRQTALHIWQNPGRLLTELEVVGSEFDNMIKQNMVMVNSTGQCWLTCRNPIVSKNIHWSQCWSFYEK